MRFTDLALLWAMVLGLDNTYVCDCYAGLRVAVSLPRCIIAGAVGFWHALVAMTGLRKANRDFIHTPHGEQTPPAQPR
ncbi:MAG: hypothetical protein R2795_03985 [Saprospiraceae bacterium]